MSWTRFRGSSGSGGAADIDALRTGIEVQHFFGEGWSAGASLPVTWLQLRGLESPPVFNGPQPTGRARVAGLGDLTLSTTFDFGSLWGLKGYAPSLRFGPRLSLPTGVSRRLDAVGVDASNVRLGAGAFSVGAQLQLIQPILKQLAAELSLFARTPLGRNEFGVRLGSPTSASLRALVIFPDVIRGLAGVSYSFRSKSHNELFELNGITGDIDNSGGHRVTAEVGLARDVGKRVTLAFIGRLPMLDKPNGTQSELSFDVAMQAIVRFGGNEEEEDEHDHGKEDAHDHGKEDAHDHGKEDAHDHPASHPGSAPASLPHTERPPPGHPSKSSSTTADLADIAQSEFQKDKLAVPGKVTVIDFWAIWCAPCIDLSRRLALLALEHPELAVRRVEIGPWESEFVKQNLPMSTGLPAVWIYDAAGRRTQTLDLVSPDDAMEAVKRQLKAHH